VTVVVDFDFDFDFDFDVDVDVDVDVGVGVGVDVDVEVDSAVVVLFFLSSSSLIVYPIINFTAIFIWDYRLVTAAVSSSSSVDASLSKFVNLAIWYLTVGIDFVVVDVVVAFVFIVVGMTTAL